MRWRVSISWRDGTGNEESGRARIGRIRYKRKEWRERNEEREERSL